MLARHVNSNITLVNCGIAAPHAHGLSITLSMKLHTPRDTCGFPRDYGKSRYRGNCRLTITYWTAGIDHVVTKDVVQVRWSRKFDMHGPIKRPIGLKGLNEHVYKYHSC